MGSKLKMIALCQLRRSKTNVRKTDSLIGIEQLADNIDAEGGVLQNLVVHPDGDGNYSVDAGGRRLAALKLLVKRKRIARDYPVPCLVKEEGDALEVSLAENFARIELHPADQFEAFAELHNSGVPVDDIAAKFGVTSTFVLQRLKLSTVSPRLIAEYRKGAMTLEQLAAFALCDDHQRQDSVWFESPYTDTPARMIRQFLTQSQVESHDKRARFIGTKAYQAAGGVVVRDLFDSENEGYFADSQLLDRLVAEFLELAAVEVRAEGWQWVEVHPEWNYAPFVNYGRAESIKLPLSKTEEKRLTKLAKHYDELVTALEENGGDESELNHISAEIDQLQAKQEGWSDQEKTRAGAVVSLGSDGKLKVVRGLVRPELSRPKSADSKGEVVKKNGRSNGYSDAVLLELSAELTAALQEVVAAQPDVALTTLLHNLVGRLFYKCSIQSCVGIVVTVTKLDRASEKIKDSKAARAFQTRHDGWSNQLPEPEKLWDWLASLDNTERLGLLAHCVGMTVNALYDVTGRSDYREHVDMLAKAMGLDMHAWWRPSQSFLDRLTKAEILTAVSEGVSPNDAKRLDGLKKDQLTGKAEMLLAQSTWLPGPLKTECVSGGSQQ